MEIVNFLAQLWGFSLIIICLSCLVKNRHIKNTLALAEDEVSLLLLGLITVILGLASVLTYSVWDHSWRVVITILGWLTLLKGTACLFFPETITALLAKHKKLFMDWVSVALVAGVLLGCLLVYFGLSF